MKGLSLIFCTFLIISGVFGQNQIVNWTYDTESINDHEVLVTFSAEIKTGWKLYSQFTEAGGPLPTSFSIVPGDGVEIVGAVNEISQAKKARSDLFEIDVTSFSDQAEFTQLLDTRDGGSEVYAIIKYMCCDGIKCIPPTEKKIKIEL